MNPSTRIAALFVDPRGVYSGIEDVDCWGEERDARKYAGPHPVVAHPPCSRWCQLAPIVEKRYGYELGDDGGCFEAALASVRKWGGVLEHPAFSYAWPAFELPKPRGRGWYRDMIDGGWVCELSQAAYGHPARKLTWLYYCGEPPPPSLDWRRPAATGRVSNYYHGDHCPCCVQVKAQVSWCANHGDSPLPRISKKAASATPIAFRDELIAMARSARKEAA